MRGGDRRRGVGARLGGAGSVAGTGAALAFAREPPARARLLERELFLSELRVLFSTDWDRPVGAVVLEGRLGSGKTAMLGAACALAASSGWSVLRAAGTLTGRHEPYGLLRHLLAADADRSCEASVEQVVAALEARTRVLSSSHGVVFAVDDARLCDEASIEWLARLDHAAPQSGIRLLLAVGTRPPGTRLEPVDWILSERSCRVLPLTPLSVDAVAILLEEVLVGDRPPDAAFVRACHEATGGVPGLLFALVHELALRGIPPLDAAATRLEAVTSSAVARSVLARCAPAPPEARRLLEVVAVAAVPIELDLAAEAARLDPARAAAAAEALVAADLLGNERVLELQPPLVRRTVLAEIPASRRRRLHAAIAEGLRLRWAPLEQLAEHLVEREPAPDEHVARILEEAGEGALAHGAAGRALRYLSAALAAEPPGVGRRRILLARTRAEALVDATAALGHLGVALDQGVSAVAAGKVALEIAGTLATEGRAAAAGELLGRIAERLEAREEPVGLEVAMAATLLHRVGAVPALLVDAVAGRSGRPNGGRGDLAQRAAALSAVLLARSAIHPAAGLVDALSRVLTGVELTGDGLLSAELWSRALLTLGRAGEPGAALRRGLEALEVARERQLSPAQAELSLAVAALHHLVGELPVAEELARAAVALAEEEPGARRGDAAACLAALLLDAGRLDEADALLAGMAGELAEEPSPLEGARLLEARGRLRLLQGQWSEALCDLLRAGQWADERGVDSPAATSWRGLAAMAFAAVGREEEASRLAAEQLELARALGTPGVVADALRTLAATLPVEARRDLLEEAVALAASSPARLVQAAALVDLGRTLRQGGATGRARVLLREGADMAVARGCAPLVTVASAELRLAGARPRRLALRGAAALTTAERRVAELAAAGSTNAQIAETLYLSEKTVEGHLFRAYRKLGVSSRRQLGALLAGVPGVPAVTPAARTGQRPTQLRGSDDQKSRVFPHAGGA